MRQALSLVIITFNEEKNIGECIESVSGIADEILILDSFSTDKTCEIARSMGARVEQHVFDGHIQQKNRAKNMARNDWVLSLDADEKLSPELYKSLEKVLEEPDKAGYEMNRLNFFCGKPVRTCGWYPDRKLRLWRKDLGDWGGINPHDKFLLKGDLPLGFLHGDILHNTYPTKKSMEDQVLKFAGISANQNKKRNTFYLIFKMLFSPIFKFIRNYILKLGFTSGSAGLFICGMQAKEVYLKYKNAIILKSEIQ